jgi:Fe-S oxidoreductase
LTSVATRQTFAGLAHWEIVLWYVLSGVSSGIFVLGIVLLVRKYRQGRGGVRFDDPFRRIGRAVRVVLAHTWIFRRDRGAGLGHLLIFYGYVVLFAGTIILAIQGEVARPLFGFDFWRGEFYLGYSFFLDIAGAALILGLAVMATKRLRRPFRLNYWRPDRSRDEYDRRPYVIGDWVFVGSLFFLGITGFLLEAFRIAQTNPSFEAWSPLGWAAAQAFRSAGLTGAAASTAHFVQWWVHGIAALAFVAAIPYTKALHMLTGPASIALHDPSAKQRLLPLPPATQPSDVGYALITDLAPKYLLQVDACTKCGKCHDVCPATSSGYPLSPRDLVLDIREAAEGSLGIRGTFGVPPHFDVRQALLGEPIRADTLWSCMNCMACVEICPVGIEHVPIINQLRRRLVEDGDLDPQLQGTLETIYETGNSFGEPKRRRARWTTELEFPVKDARREPVELLWFVGDYASFDPRNQRVTQSVARLLHRARIDFGILYEAEQNAGNDVRRVGEEGLYTTLVEKNINTLRECDFSRILTTDPHTYNTLKNEYPEFGGAWDVLHHSELLLELLDEKRLLPSRQLDVRVTYHDPCALGRYNGVYDPPRKVLAAVGAELVEMPRNRDNSFCCGAGGGRIWMKELRDRSVPSPSEQRIEEAVAIGDIDYFVVTCPKDVTMYEDAIKTSGHAAVIELRELAELVLESVSE